MIKDVELLDIKQKHKNGMSIADIALGTGYCEKTVSKWLKHDGVPRYQRAKKPSKLDPYKEYIMKRMVDGVFNCEVLFREIKGPGSDYGMLDDLDLELYPAQSDVNYSAKYGYQ